MTMKEAQITAVNIIDDCIGSLCMNHDWDECKEQARAMFTTACIIGCVQADTNISDFWLDRIYKGFHLKDFRDEFEYYMLEYII